MTDLKNNKRASEDARALRWTRLLSNPGGGTAAILDPLTVDAVLPGNRPEYAEDNLLPIEALVKDLDVTIDAVWPGTQDPTDVGQEEHLKFFIGLNPTPFHTVTLKIPFADNGVRFPLTVPLPYQNFQSPGTYELYYIAENSLELTEESQRVLFTVDRTAPPNGGHPEPITVPVEIIDKAYLEANSEFVCKVPNYSDKRPGDQVFGWLAVNGEDPVGPFIASDSFQPADDPASEMTLRFPASAFEALPDGYVHIRYLLKDRAGNEGFYSQDKRVYLQLLDPPAGLLPPSVPLADVDLIIDRADAQMPGGVTVEVPAYTIIGPNDTVEVYWAGNLLQRFTGVNPSTPFPLVASVPFATLAFPDFGPRPVQVEYRIVRGPIPYPSPVRDLTVDLSQPGPTDPGPGPGNPLLGIPRLFGGGPTPVENKILVPDIGFAATVLIETPIGVAPDDHVQLYFNGLPVPAPGGVHDFDGSETPGDPVSMSIPYSMIQPIGDGPAFPLFFRLTNPDVLNPNDSLTAFIEIRTFVLGTIEPPVFTDRSAAGNVNCNNNIWDGVKVGIKPDTQNFAPGDTVYLEYEGMYGLYGDPSSWQPIPGTGGSLEHEIQTGEPASGFQLVIPFEPHIHAIGEVSQGMVVARVRLVKQDGSGTGTSERDRARIGITWPNGCKCVSAGACLTAS